MPFSIIIPVHNEQDNVIPLWKEIQHVLKFSTFEIIFVNDGSTDHTAQRLSTIRKRNVHTITLKRNHGQSFALRKGSMRAKYSTIITMDGDRQCDPQDISHLLSKMDEGYDCVCGKRVKRDDPLLKKISSRIANKIRSLVLHDHFSDSSSPLKAMKKKAYLSLPYFDGNHRFLPVLFRMKSYQVCEIPVHHRKRTSGKSHYGTIHRCMKSLHDLIAVHKMLKQSK